MPALDILCHFSFMTLLALYSGRRGQYISPLMLNSPRVIGFNLMTITAGYFGSSHGAVTELLHDPWGVIAVAGDALIRATCQNVHLLQADLCPGMADHQDHDRSSHHNDDCRQTDDQGAERTQRFGRYSHR